MRAVTTLIAIARDTRIRAAALLMILLTGVWATGLPQFAFRAAVSSMYTQIGWPGVDLPVDFRASGKPVTFQIGDRRFRVPRNYMSGGVPSGDWTVTDGIFLTVLLPDLEPFSYENAAEFRKVGWNDKLRIYISYNPHRLPEREVFSIYRNNYIDPNTNIETINDINLYRGNYDKYNRDYLVFDDGSNFEFFTCSVRPLRREGPFHPGCDTYERIDDRVVIKMAFNRDYQPEIMEVRRKVLCLVREFLIDSSFDVLGGCG